MGHTLQLCSKQGCKSEPFQRLRNVFIFMGAQVRCGGGYTDSLLSTKRSELNKKYDEDYIS